MGCAQAIGIRNTAVPQINPKITQADLIGRSFICLLSL